MTRPKKKRVHHLRRNRGHRKRDRRFPISGGVGLGALVLAEPSGWKSPVEYIQAGDWKDAGYAGVRNLVGLDLKYGQNDFMQIINPIDFGAGAAWKTALWSALILKTVKHFTGDMFTRIPFVGKYVKMS